MSLWLLRVAQSSLRPKMSLPSFRQARKALRLSSQVSNRPLTAMIKDASKCRRVKLLLRLRANSWLNSKQVSTRSLPQAKRSSTLRLRLLRRLEQHWPHQRPRTSRASLNSSNRRLILRRSFQKRLRSSTTPKSKLTICSLLTFICSIAAKAKALLFSTATLSGWTTSRVSSR